MARRKLLRFHTGMVLDLPNERRHFPMQGKNWSLTLFDPDDSRWPHSRFDTNPPREIAINAADRGSAEKAIELLWAAHTLICHELWMGYGDIVNNLEPANVDGGPRGSLHRMSGFPEACRLACKASRDLALTYALAKHYCSMEMYFVAPNELGPDTTHLIPKFRKNPIHQVRVAQSIVLSYSAIEEMGLEVRASRQNPSSINGQWNPPVLRDLEKRLINAGIDLASQFPWHVRGAKTNLESAKPRQIHATAKRADWAHTWGGPKVRDMMVDIVDAIAHLSWLRSSVSSHRFNTGFIKNLSVYDATNGQLLVRRLFLESVGGFEKYWYKQT